MIASESAVHSVGDSDHIDNEQFVQLFKQIYFVASRMNTTHV